MLMNFRRVVDMGMRSHPCPLTLLWAILCCLRLCAVGMAMGTGSAVASRAVDSLMGPREVVHRHEGAPEPAAAQPAPAPGHQQQVRSA